MKAIVVLKDADINNFDFKDCFIIGVEQGCKLLISNNIPIDLSMADFDSIDDSDLKDIKKYSQNTIILNSLKDETDTFMAVKKAFEFADEVIILGGVEGSRVEHLIANINLFYHFDNLKMITKNSVIYTINKSEEIIKDKYEYISFYALKTVDELTLVNFKYPLNEYNLLPYDNICISNELIDNGKVIISNGKLLVIKSLKLK